MKILVTGTPGTGKSTNARKLASKLKIPYINVTTIINTHPEFVENIEDNVRVIKPEIREWLIKNLPKDYVIDSHLIEYMPSADVVVILRCNPAELKKRLKERKYSKDKIRENLEVEILDYFTQKTRKRKVIEIDTSKRTSDENVNLIMKMMKSRKWNKGEIRWNRKKYMDLLLN